MSINFQPIADVIEEMSVEGVGGIFLGNLQSVRDSAFLLKNKVTHILSVLPHYLYDAEEYSEVQVKTKIITYDDSNLDQSLQYLMSEAADFIHEGSRTGNVLISCLAGLTRSPAFLIAYYIKYRNLTRDAALSLLVAKTVLLKINREFFNQLARFEDFW